MCSHPSKGLGGDVHDNIGNAKHLDLRKDQNICKIYFTKITILLERETLEVIYYNSLPISQREDFLEEVFQYPWK